MALDTRVLYYTAVMASLGVVNVKLYRLVGLLHLYLLFISIPSPHRCSFIPGLKPSFSANPFPP